MMTNEAARVARYRRSGYRQVEGLVYGGALGLVERVDAAQKALGISGHVGEIGVFLGRLFALLCLLRRRDEVAVAVDLFEDDGRRFHEEFVRNVTREVGSMDRIAVLQRDSTTLTGVELQTAAGGPLRLLSVDGGHTAAVVRHDLALARDALGEGGVIVLDDYFQESWPGVSEGTNRFFLQDDPGDLVPFVIGANKLLLTHRPYADRYRAAVQVAGLPAKVRERTLFGAPVLTCDFSPVNILGVNLSRRLTDTPAWRIIRDRPLGRMIRFRLRRSLAIPLPIM